MEIEKKSKCEPGGGDGRSNSMESRVTAGLRRGERERYRQAQTAGGLKVQLGILNPETLSGKKRH